MVTWHALSSGGTVKLSQTFLIHRRFMSVCPACSTALCVLIGGETREVIPRKIWATSPCHDVMQVSDRCGDMELAEGEFFVLLREIFLIAVLGAHLQGKQQLLKCEIPQSNSTAFFCICHLCFYSKQMAFIQICTPRTAFGWVLQCPRSWLMVC